MYVGIDVGGTKTLVAVLDDDGQIVEQDKFPTPKKYQDFLKQLDDCHTRFMHHDFRAGAIGLPGRLDRKRGHLIRLSNLSWQDEPAQADCEKIFKCPVVIENDANLAGLSESKLKPEIEKVLYVTISTGIGTGYTYKQQLDPSLVDLEGGQVLLPYKNQLTRWELFASGRAIAEHFGKPAADIPASDTDSWKYVVRNLIAGLFACIAIVEPDLIIIGGSMGVYFDRYGALLQSELEKHALPVVKIPKLVEAQRPEEAVIYGCYDLAKQVYGHA